MKSKTYRNGRTTFRAYLRDCGNGYEVGFVCGPKTIFVGNFLHSWEANQWYTQMNMEIRAFSRRFTVGRNCPTSWYSHFLGANLYKKYYSFLNRVFIKHTRNYNRAVNTDARKYRRLNRNWSTSERTPFLKAA